MNIFKRIFGKSEENLSTLIPEKEDRDRELEERVYSLYPVGMEFKYLGLTMRVAEHCKYNHLSSSIVCHYLNGQGLIEPIFFNCSEVDLWGEPK